MPRTKRAPKSAETKPASNTRSIIAKRIDEEENKALEKLEKQKDLELRQLNVDFSSILVRLPRTLLTRTVGEVKNGEVNNSELSTTGVVHSDLTTTFNSTRHCTQNSTRLLSSASSLTDINKTKVAPKSKRHGKRSISVGCDDEGYTTAESSRGTTSGESRKSRAKVRTSTRLSSRSLSNKTISGKANTYKTPSQKVPQPGNTGSITPKCKPNTPLLYVRRPKIGEMAWSNQGSPLLVTNTVAPEATANVNIPVGGDILSMLPTRGVMRQSQIPDVDEDTRRQLEILRDNLIKVCDTIRK